MTYPKFIIQNKTLICGFVEYHHELKQDDSPVKGGGWFNIKNQRIIFWKDSQEFGKAKQEDIQSCIDNSKVIGLDLSQFSTIKIEV